MGQAKLPKPSGTYYYKPENGTWELMLQHASPIMEDWDHPQEGWIFAIFSSGEERLILRFGLIYDTKTKAWDRAIQELRDLGFPENQIESMKNTDSVYRYLTFPVMCVWSHGSKWKWRCGKNRGEEKTKKLAIQKACEHRKDV